MTEQLEFKENSLRDALGAETRCSIFWLRTCSSTMDEARTRLKQSAEQSPFVVFCDAQTEGRGQSGNVWKDTPSGIAATYAVEPFGSQSQCLGLSLVVGVSVARAISNFSIPLKVKWPNDLLNHRDEKVGGILIELEEYEGQVYPLIGIGLNLFEPPSGIENSSGLGFQSDRVAVPAAITDELLKDIEKFRQDGFSAFLEEFQSVGAFISEDISLESNGESHVGAFVGVNADGALILRNNGGEESEFYSAQNIRRIF